MLKTISRIGNSQGLIFDATLRELTGLKEGDEVNVTVHEGGSIVITPMRQTLSADEAARAAIQQMDTASLRECRRIFTISKNVARRLEHWLDHPWPRRLSVR